MHFYEKKLIELGGIDTEIVRIYIDDWFENVLASGDNRHSGSGEKRQFWSTENSHLQFE